MLQEQLRVAEGESERLGRETNKLLVAKNPAAKTQYLDQLRAEVQTHKKEVSRLQEENKGLRTKSERVTKTMYSIINTNIRKFCINICRVLQASHVDLEAELSLGTAQQTVEALEAYLHKVLNRVQEGAAALKKRAMSNVLN